MPDFNVRSDAVNVEQIMEQIRSRIREKRGVDYTEAQIQELASVKLEKFLDPRGVRSDLLEQYRRAQPPFAPPELPNFAFEEQTLFESTRGPLRFIRRLLLPILKLFFNPNPLIHALNIQSRLNASAAEREARRDAARYAFDQLHYEVMHNLVLETTRLGIEVKNLKMRLESLASRLEFNERRARALESAVVYKPAADERLSPDNRRDESRRDERRDDNRRDDSRRDQERRPDSRRTEQQPRQQPVAPQPAPQIAASAGTAPIAEGPVEGAPQGSAPVPEGPGQKSRRRRRRRGRRGGGSASTLMAAGGQGDVDQGADGDQHSDESPFDGEADANAPMDGTTVEETPDSREARPEPFEHAFGAQAHPAEPAASDPAHEVVAGHGSTPAPAAVQPEAPQPESASQPESKPQEPTSPDPSAAPEQ